VAFHAARPQDAKSKAQQTRGFFIGLLSVVIHTLIVRVLLLVLAAAGVIEALTLL
jgi:hypothetical protein